MVPLQKSTGFSHVSVMAICCALGALLPDNMFMGALCLCIIAYIIILVTRAHSKLVAGLLCLRFILGKSRHCFQFSSFFIALLLCMCRDQHQPGGLARQPLTTIPFKIRVDNSLKYFPLPAYKKNFLSFPPCESLIPCRYI